jgi:hypothetical protein
LGGGGGEELVRALVVFLGLGVVATLGAACGAGEEGGVVPSPTATVAGGGATGVPLEEYPEPVQAAVADLAERLGLEPGEIEVVEVEPVDWPDACLGAALEREVCAQVVTPGYRVVLSAGDREYEYHTDLETAVRLVPWERI